MKCRICKNKKPLADFRKNKTKPEGRDTICKSCYNQKAKRYLKRYRETPAGRANQTWHKILQRVGNKNGKNPSYSDIELHMTQEDFTTWITPQYEQWEIEHPNETPSINRIDPYGHYELDNLEVISLEANILKPKRKFTSHTKSIRTKKLVKYVQDRCSTYDLDLSEVINLLSQ